MLTYQLFSGSTMLDMSYNVIEVFQKMDGKWEVIRSTWDMVCAFSSDEKKPKGVTQVN